MQEIPLSPANPQANLKDYEKACATFHWEGVAREFDWYGTGKVNMAHEAIVFFWGVDGQALSYPLIVLVGDGVLGIGPVEGKLVVTK